MAGTKGGCQEIHTRMLQMSAEQSSTPEKGRRTSSIGNTSRTMARNQYRYYRTITKVKRDGCDSRHCRLIHENDSFEDNNNKCFIGGSSKDLQG